MKRSSRTWRRLAVLLPVVVLASCATYIKVFGGLPNKGEYLKQFDSLIGSQYYRYADVTSAGPDAKSLTVYELTSVDLELVEATLDGDYCVLTYTLDDGAATHKEVRLFRAGRQSNSELSQMLVGIRHPESTPVSDAFDATYIRVSEGDALLARQRADRERPTSAMASAPTPAQPRERLERARTVSVLLSGEARGIKVSLDLGNIPDQSIDASVASETSLVLAMTIESTSGISLNGIADRLAFAFNGQMADTRLMSLKTRRSYPSRVLAGTKATFEVEVLPEPFVGFIVGMPFAKMLLLDAAGTDDATMALNTVRELYGGSFYIASLDLEIPMQVEVSLPQ